MQRIPVTFALCVILVASGIPLHAQEVPPPVSDTTGAPPPAYDPFGPEHAPDHSGQGSGGVVTPSPYENLVQTYYTRMNADYYGVQFMLDSPLQVSAGTGWSMYQSHPSGLLLKVRGTGARMVRFDPLRREDVPYYFLPFEASIDRPFRENRFRALKVRLHLMSEPKGLSMAGMGVLVSRWNVLMAFDRTMDRRSEVEATWIQVAGGYIMPLSPRVGGINLALCGAVDLIGMKYQAFFSGPGEFLGIKVGSIGWLFGAGWNTSSLMNLGAYAGGEWSFSAGGLRVRSKKTVLADLARTTIFLGLQATGRWFNLTGGIQKEWEYMDYQTSEKSEKALRYHLGANVYFRR
ncbi:MAG: hypothetical protein AB1428_09820 [Bacteroidota bacterium]